MQMMNVEGDITPVAKRRKCQTTTSPSLLPPTPSPNSSRALPALCCLAGVLIPQELKSALESLHRLEHEYQNALAGNTPCLLFPSLTWRKAMRAAIAHCHNLVSLVRTVEQQALSWQHQDTYRDIARLIETLSQSSGIEGNEEHKRECISMCSFLESQVTNLQALRQLGNQVVNGQAHAIVVPASDSENEEENNHINDTDIDDTVSSESSSECSTSSSAQSSNSDATTSDYTIQENEYESGSESEISESESSEDET